MEIGFISFCCLKLQTEKFMKPLWCELTILHNHKLYYIIKLKNNNNYSIVECIQRTNFLSKKLINQYFNFSTKLSKV